MADLTDKFNQLNIETDINTAANHILKGLKVLVKILLPDSDFAHKAKKEAILKVLPLSKNAVIPQRGTDGAAGFDLSSAADYNIMPGEIKKIATDLSIEPPPGCYGRVAARSGWALKGLSVAADVIDADYRGPLYVLLRNFADHPIDIQKGDRIAQLVCEKIATPKIEVCTVRSFLPLVVDVK